MSDEEDQDDCTVLQFDPTQADNVYRAKQVESAEYSGKNADGTELRFHISGIEDPLGEAFLLGEQNSNNEPMFDFLGDQPDVEQQEHTETAKKEAMDSEGVVRKEPQRRRPVKKTRSKTRPRPAIHEGEGRPRVTKPTGESTDSSAALKKSESDHSKQPKRMVNEAKNYSRFFKESKQAEEGGGNDFFAQLADRPKHRPQARQRRPVEDHLGQSESEAEMTSSRPRRVRKKPVGDKKVKKAAAAMSKATDNLESSYAMSESEAVEIRRRDLKSTAPPLPDASMTEDEATGTSAARRGRKTEHVSPETAPTSDLPAPGYDTDATDPERSPTRKHKSVKSSGLAVSIGRYFARPRKGGNSTDVEGSDAENQSVGSSSRFKFGGLRKRQDRHLLLDGSASSLSLDDTSLDLGKTLTPPM
jgi:hypothetical protein